MQKRSREIKHIENNQEEMIELKWKIFEGKNSLDGCNNRLNCLKRSVDPEDK